MKDMAAVKELVCDGVLETGFVEHIVADLGLTAVQVYQWSMRDVDFRNNLARAQKLACMGLVARTLLIPDQESDVQRARLKCENNRWAASKLDPDRFGDRQHITIDGDLSLLQARMVNASERVLEGECEVIEPAQLEDLL